MGARFHGRGQYALDASNAEGQEDGALADFRLGLRKSQWFVEGWVRNAFDEEYIPVALPYPGLALSRYTGESGAPAAFGFRFGLDFEARARFPRRNGGRTRRGNGGGKT